MPRGRCFGIRCFVCLSGRARLRPLGVAQGGIQSKVWRALQQTMVQPKDKVSPWWGICEVVQVSGVKNSLSGLTHLSLAASLLFSTDSSDLKMYIYCKMGTYSLCYVYKCHRCVFNLYMELGTETWVYSCQGGRQEKAFDPRASLYIPGNCTPS